MHTVSDSAVLSLDCQFLTALRLTTSKPRLLPQRTDRHKDTMRLAEMTPFWFVLCQSSCRYSKGITKFRPRWLHRGQGSWCDLLCIWSIIIFCLCFCLFSFLGVSPFSPFCLLLYTCSNILSPLSPLCHFRLCGLSCFLYAWPLLRVFCISRVSLSISFCNLFLLYHSIFIRLFCFIIFVYFIKWVAYTIFCIPFIYVLFVFFAFLLSSLSFVHVLWSFSPLRLSRLFRLFLYRFVSSVINLCLTAPVPPCHVSEMQDRSVFQ